MFSEFDRQAMTRALALAERGLETTHPNPRVGCVISKGDRIIAEGFHERAGEAHAEVAALRAAKEPVAGATVYVTLEPCSHHGRTPPCVNALIEARVARVVFAVQDPNPQVSGQGAGALLRAGITVEAGLMEAEATELNIGFMKRMKHGLPWVRIKLAMSLDGRTALANGASQWITGEAARFDVQRWRARCSAVMTGVGTVLADDPQLNVRAAGFKGRQPLRVVLDSYLRSSPGAKVFAGAIAGGAAGSAGAAGSGGAAGAAGASSRTGGDGAPAAGKAGAGTSGRGAADALPGGGVIVFAAVGGGGIPVAASAAGLAAAAASHQAAAAGLGDDMEDLVKAFESLPGSVTAKSDEVSGEVSAKSERVGAPAAKGATGGRVGTSPGVQGAGPVGTGQDAPGASPVAAGANPAAAASHATPAATHAAPALTQSAAGPSSSAAPSGQAPLQEAGATAAIGGLAAAAAQVAPGPGPTAPGQPLASGQSTAQDAPAATSLGDDATWAGAALSGAVQVGRQLGSAPAAAALPNAMSPSSGSALSGGGVAAAVATTTPPLPPVLTKAGTESATVASGAKGPTGAGSSGGPATVGSSAEGSVSAGSSPAPATTKGPAPPAASGSAAIGGDPPPPAVFQARRHALMERGVRVEEVPADEGFLDLFSVFQRLAQLEVNEVLVEAGPTLAGQLLTTFFADELLLYVAPKLLGPQGRPLVNLPELQSLQDAWGFALFDAKRFGDDLRLRFRPK